MFFSNNLNEILVNFDKMCLLLKRTYKDINHYYKVININWRYKMNKEDYFNEERIKLEQLLMEQIKEYRNLLDGILKDLDLIIKPLK
ncbi:hypothetical protein TUBRATIS_001570 [Tubulinosema ratisbonensis]|uniref:Uncharacterized protein n=1 Tax=Tubulinosema ratisbonensis TaxID=291195 RepID=A0A437AQC4_9MICR|nr:hypothetical protein TUBRATIS_001570 [Tubulinosema ratisbonensis]